MEQSNSIYHLLDLMTKPAFCVRDGVILHVNQAAKLKLFTEGCDIFSLLPTAAEAYRAFRGGCLYLTVSCADIPCGASVTRTEDVDIFVLEDEADSVQLEALSLAAKQLRIPLSNLMAVLESHFSSQPADDRNARTQAAQISRGLHQMHRVVNNMADAAYWGSDDTLTETLDLSSLFDEVIEKAAAYLVEANIKLNYTGLKTAVYALTDRSLLERAIYNLISNAAKFSLSGSTLEARLTKSESQLSFSICDRTQKNAQQLHGNLFNRYLRQPGIEDRRFGVGLGMTLICSAATAHGGTVLIDQPEAGGTRVTMTLSIRQSDSCNVHSPVLRISDYTGGKDPALLELSDILPTTAYMNELS